MIEFETKMINSINALDKEGILQNCIISGSWCMYFYKYIFDSFIPPIATTDLDLFLPSVSKLKDSNISKVLTDLDYHRDDDYLSGKTTFLSKEGFKLFLIAA